MTEKSTKLKSSTLEQHAGWVPGSNMHKRYVHYFGNESSIDILEAYGIVTKDNVPIDTLNPKAKNKGEHEKMVHYASLIQKLQHDLGLEISSFPNIGMLDSSFLWQIAQKEDNNQEEQVISDEDYQTDRYEQERLTDAYSEYFRDDCNKGDRFTS